MKNTEAKIYICPFMSRPVEILGKEPKFNYFTLFEAQCEGKNCMAWTAEDDSHGSCGLVNTGEIKNVCVN